tara:strand:+ start:15 stop:119 length:105 start_codon:yes stop_codon:yes gene_type:complete
LSVGLNEKNATSDPEIIPEKIRSMMQDTRGVKKL